MSLGFGALLAVLIYGALYASTLLFKEFYVGLAHKANHIVPLKRRNGYRNSETGSFVSTEWVREVEADTVRLLHYFLFPALAVLPILVIVFL